MVRQGQLHVLLIVALGQWEMLKAPRPGCEFWLHYYICPLWPWASHFPWLTSAFLQLYHLLCRAVGRTRGVGACGGLLGAPRPNSVKSPRRALSSKASHAGWEGAQDRCCARVSFLHLCQLLGQQPPELACPLRPTNGDTHPGPGAGELLAVLSSRKKLGVGQGAGGNVLITVFA